MQSELINGLAPIGQNGLASLSSRHVTSGRRPVGALEKCRVPGPAFPNSSSALLRRGSCLFWLKPQSSHPKREKKKPISLSRTSYGTSSDEEGQCNIKVVH